MRYFESLKAKGKSANPTKKVPPWRIALVANLKDEIEWEEDDPPDAGAEYDRRETVEALARALEADGHWVHICTGDGTLPEAFLNLRPHICFNIAEGLGGDAREAQVPALCELLDIPYTASRVLANALSLDKTRTKHLWQSMGLPTPAFQEFRSVDEPLDPGLSFPMFVKPALEGSGMGIDNGAVVHDEASMRERIGWVLETYHQPVLVETYLSGREFTVGFLGNRFWKDHRRRPWLYDEDGYHFFPILEIDSRPSVSPGVYGHDAKSLDIGDDGAPAYLCPADISLELRAQLCDLTRRAAEALGAFDVSRVDIRLSTDGRPYLMEINTLPGLNPKVSDLCIMAGSEGMPYDVLISEILYLAAARYGLPFDSLPGPEDRVIRPVTHPSARVVSHSRLIALP